MRKNKNTILYSLAIVIGIIILINILADFLFIRLDFSSDKRYTLSKSTKDIIKSIKEPVTVKAYFSENLPPDILKTRRDFKEILVEYRTRSRGLIEYEFIDPNKNQELEQEALRNGIQPVLINVREKDQVKQQKAFLGAIVQMGDKKEIIPIIQPGAAIEYDLSTSIKKLSVNEKVKIAYLQGHGEPSLRSLQQAHQALSILYNVEEVNLVDTAKNLTQYKTLIIVAPKDSFPSSHLAQLDEFIADGKNILIAINTVEGDFSNAMGKVISTGLEKWLNAKGISVEQNFVIDANCGTVTAVQQQGPIRFQTMINFPYLPIISNFADHPVTKGIESVQFPFASTITWHGDSGFVFIPLVKSSNKSGVEMAPLYFNINRQWTQNDFTLSNLTLGAAVTGKFKGNKEARIILFSDGDFMQNGEGNQARQLPADNVNLFVNAVDWLSDDTGLINLRTKGVTSRPLDQISDEKKIFLKYLNFLLPIIIIIIYGILRIQRNRNIRFKRMEEGYV
jgi:gliding-associated putative ABC transporter substrate-binding component GldG